MSEALAGKLLVATPELLDPNFARSVVFVVEHDDVEGTLGIVINRPSGIGAAAHLPDWSASVAQPDVVFVGGPVTPEVALGLADTPADPPPGWAPVISNIGLIDLATTPGAVGGVLRLRIFAGYAGWVVGQLEAELEENAWFVVDAVSGDLFAAEPEDLWRTVLRRQPPPLSWYAHFPLHPRLN